MEYFAGLDVSMKETHICVLDRSGGVVLETRTSTQPEAIATVLAKAPRCERVVLETGRMAPTLYHGLEALGVPVICIESRQAYQALKSLATHKTDRNDARGLAQLARTGLLQARLREVAAGPCRSGADPCAQEAGRTARHPREPDPRPGRRVWGPAAARAQPGLREAGPRWQRRGCGPHR